MNSNQLADKNIHDGHRGRMRSKLASHGADIFDTYELLEMLLYSVIPFKDTNPVAKRLLYAFGSLDGVFSASKEELMTVTGVGERVADYIKTVAMLPDMLRCEKAQKSIDFSDYVTAGRYFINYFSGLFEYKVSVILLDNNILPIKIVDLYDIDFKSAAIKPELFISTALKNRAAVAIIAHNHPFGPKVPSESDRINNNIIAEALSQVGVFLLEHYVVSGSNFIGFMTKLESTVAQTPDVRRFFESKRMASLAGYDTEGIAEG